MRAYYSMGRHKNVDCFNLAQSYTRIPKHLLRYNVNLLVTFKHDDLNLRHVYDEHVNNVMYLPNSWIYAPIAGREYVTTFCDF